MIVQFPNFKVTQQLNELVKHRKDLEKRIKRFNSCIDRTIFSGCHSSDGLKLTDDTRKTILSYLNRPTLQGWDKIYKIQVSPNKTLWNAWNLLASDKKLVVRDLNNLNEKWTTIPDPQELVLGIKSMIEKEKNSLLKMKNVLDLEITRLERKYRNYLKKYA